MNTAAKSSRLRPPNAWRWLPAITAYTLLVFCCVLVANRKALDAVCAAVVALLLAKALRAVSTAASRKETR